MTQDEKKNALAEVFECEADKLSPSTPLDTLSWDSMAMLSIIALVKVRFGRKVTGQEIRAFKTVGAIMGVMERA